jgi:drug/metabolite transporter (DMT)-like permease
MSRKALLLFLSASLIWGSSFLLVRVAVRDISPAVLVLGRTVLGAAFLVPVALRMRAFRGLRRKIPAIVVLTMLNMCLPIFLTAWAEQHITSSTAGILIATDPLFTALLALWLIRAEAVSRRQLGGLLLGFAGVVALLGLDFSGQPEALLGAAAVLLSALGYAATALLYRRWLNDTPALGASSLMMLCSSAVFLLPAIAEWPRHMPSQTSLLALVTLGIVNTGLLSWVYFALVREAGAAVTSLITYAVPVVALVLGVSLLSEKLTVGAIAGLIFIASGTWLATRARQSRPGHQAADRDEVISGRDEVVVGRDEDEHARQRAARARSFPGGAVPVLQDHPFQVRSDRPGIAGGGGGDAD